MLKHNLPFFVAADGISSFERNLSFSVTDFELRFLVQSPIISKAVLQA